MSDESNVKEKPKKRKFSKLKYIIAFIFINVIIFFVVTSQPDFEISIVPDPDAKSVEIRVTQKSFFPLQITVPSRLLLQILTLCLRLCMRE